MRRLLVHSCVGCLFFTLSIVYMKWVHNSIDEVGLVSMRFNDHGNLAWNTPSIRLSLTLRGKQQKRTTGAMFFLIPTDFWL